MATEIDVKTICLKGFFSLWSMVYSAFAKDAAWSKFDDKNENLASSKKIFYSRKTVTDQKGKFPIQMVIILGAGIWGGNFPSTIIKWQRCVWSNGRFDNNLRWNLISRKKKLQKPFLFKGTFIVTWLLKGELVACLIVRRTGFFGLSKVLFRL